MVGVQPVAAHLPSAENKCEAPQALRSQIKRGTRIETSQELDPLKGDELVSSLDRNSEDSHGSTALASTADTSGHPDKVPGLAQHAESAALSSTENVLPRHGILAWNPTVQLERYRAGEPSLSGEPECLSLQEVV
jgi:hypothetical protein